MVDSVQHLIRSVISGAPRRMASTVNKTAHPFNKANLEALLNRRFFYAPAFEIYGGMCANADLFTRYPDYKI